MYRVIFLFVAALVVANTTGLLPEADDVECTDQGEGKQCPPTCPTCSCAWHTLRSALTPMVEMKPLELTSSAAEPPPPGGTDGRTAPPPTTRPPIA